MALKITGFRIGLLSAGLRVPFRTALREVRRLEDVVVELQTSDGRTGRGGGPADSGHNRRDAGFPDSCPERLHLPQARREGH